MSQKNYIIVIPSYNRPELIKKKTLALLERHMINPDKIYIFVSDKEQYNLYIKSLNPKYWKNIIIGVIGLLNQRKFISNYFSAGKFILHLDDDLDNIIEINDYIKKDAKDINDLDSFIYTSFMECQKNNIGLWGIHPTDNPYFMSHGISINLKLIVGCFFGVINDPILECKVMICEKEDYERTILYYEKYGKIMRHNYIGIKTNYFKNPGGLQSSDLNHNRQEEALKSVNYLLNKYPNCCRRLDKKNMPDIRLNNRYRSLTKESY